jgi:hypothetical protein
MLVSGQPVKNTDLSVLLGCTQACRQLGGSMLACRHDGMLVDGHPSSSEEMIVASVMLYVGAMLLVRWGMQTPQTSQHSWPPPGSWSAGRWPAREEGGQECGSVCAAWVHPSMPVPPVVGMLACLLMASQRGRRAKNIGMSVLLGCTPASQIYQHPCRWHASMCWHTGQWSAGEEY